MLAQVDRLAPFPQIHFLYVNGRNVPVRVASKPPPFVRVVSVDAPREFHAVGVGGEALLVRRRAYFYLIADYHF